MKKENKCSSISNHNKAWKWFEQNGYANHSKMVLHYKDVNMKKDNPERYNQWNVEDLIPMTLKEHRRLHMKLQNKKGCKHSKKHNENIKKAMKKAVRNKIVKIYIDATPEDAKYFNTLAEAARYIGCTR